MIYRIAEFDFIMDDIGSVDVFFGENSVGHFIVSVEAGRQAFMQACEDYYATEMVY